MNAIDKKSLVCALETLIATAEKCRNTYFWITDNTAGGGVQWNVNIPCLRLPGLRAGTTTPRNTSCSAHALMCIHGGGTTRTAKKPR